MNDYFPIDCATTLLRIGLMVKASRLAQDVRQKDVTARLGVPEKMLRRIERGDPAVSARTLMLVLWQLGLMERIFRSLEDSSVSYTAIEEANRGRRVRRRHAKREDF